MEKNRSTWSTLLAVVLAMVVMAGLAVTAFAVTDGGAGNNSIPVVEDIAELTAVLNGTTQPDSNINYDVDGNGIVENADLVVLQYLKGEGEPLADPDDLLDLLTQESKDDLQSLIVKGDSTRAVALQGGQSVTLTFAEALNISNKQSLQLDVLWPSATGSFQVVFLSSDKETAPVTVAATKAGWSTAEVSLDNLDTAVIANVTGIQITLAEGNTTYFDNFRAEGKLIRFDVSFEGMSETLEVITGRPYGQLPVPVKTFYTFEGWYYGEEKVTADTIVTAEAEHTLSAKWTMIASDDGTITVTDEGNNAFGLAMDGSYKQIRFQFNVQSGNFHMYYADNDTTVTNNPVVVILEANGNAVSQSKVQPGQWYTAIIYGGSVTSEEIVIQDGAQLANGTLTFATGLQMQVRNLETLTGQYGLRFLGRNNQVWKMTDETAVVDGKHINGYNFNMDISDPANLYDSRWGFNIYRERYTKMTYEFYIYELGGKAANGQVTGLKFTTDTSAPPKFPQPVVYDMDGNIVASADVKAGVWYKVELDMTGISGTQFLYTAVTAGTYKAYVTNVSFVGNGEMLDNLSPATTITVDKAGGDGAFATSPVTRDTDRGTYYVKNDSANWYDRAIRVKLNDTSKELIQLDFRFVTSKDESGKDVAPTLVASTTLSGNLTQAQYIVLDENDNPVTALETGKWYRMFITANGGDTFGLVPARTGEVELQVQGIDTFNTDELPATFNAVPVTLTKFGKLEHVYNGNGTITVDAAGYKVISFAVKGATVTGTGVTTEGSGEWKTVTVKNGGNDLGTVSLTVSGNTNGMRIKDLAAYTEADPAKKTESTIFRGLDDDEMMISGFIGPREEGYYGHYNNDQKSNPKASLATDAIFKLLAEAGINYISDNGVDYSGSGKENAEHILRLAAKYGINYFASASDVVEIGEIIGKSGNKTLYDNHIGTAAEIQAKLEALYKYESFGGLYLRDEPTADLFVKIQEAVTKINQAKAQLGNITLNQYVNLYPWHNTTGTLTNFQNYTSPSGGTAGITNTSITWEQYLKASMLDTGMNYVSFDSYPFDVENGKTVVNKGFLSFLGAAAKVSKETGKPWMGYAQVGGGLPSYNANKAITTESELNWDVNAMLAFGAKGILYYIGVTPPFFAPPAETGTDPHSLIDIDGNTTVYYDYVSTINAQIQAIDHVLMNSEHLGVILNGNGACGYTGKYTVNFRTYDIDIMPQVTKSTVKLSSISGTTLIGAFDYNGKTALLVMNNTTDNDNVADTISLTFDKPYTFEVIQDAASSAPAGLTLNLNLLPGRCALVVVGEELKATAVTVSFDATNETRTVYEGYAYGAFPIVEREGYAFGGWFTDTTYTTEVTAEDIVTNTAAHTLYAKWLQEYTVKFDLNYDDAGENPADIIVVEGNAYGDDLSVPVREGHTFLGWYVDTNYTRAVTANTVETESRTLYAKWSDVQLNPATSVITKNVTYTEDGAIFNFKAEGSVTAGDDQVLKMPLPEGVYRGFTMLVYFNECQQADGTNGVCIKPVSTNPSTAYPTPSWYDMDGNVVTNPQPKQWYKVVVTTAATDNLWLYMGNLATQNLNSLDVSIKDVEGIPLDAKVVTINPNYTGASAYSVVVQSGTMVSDLPTPNRDGHQFFSWFNSANAGTPVANTTAITADTQLYALWNVDPAIWGGTFTYLAQNSYGYYVRVAAEEVDGESEPVIKYNTRNINGNTGVTASLRRVLFNVNAAAGDVISMKVKIAAVKNAAGTSLTENTIAMHDESGNTVMVTAFTDVETGTVVADGKLTVGKWYTMTFISNGSGKYQLRPFADGGDDGTLYMKDIEVLNGSGLQGDSAVSLGAAVVDGEIVYNYKTSGTNTAQTRVLYFKNDGTHRALTYKIKFTKSECAAYEGFKGYVRHYSSGTYMYPVVTDETGKVIATDYNSCAANIKPDVWYNVILDAGEGNTLSSNIWTFTFDTDAKYDNATVEFEIKDIEYSDDVQTKHKVTYNLNYDGAPAAETFMVAANTTVGALPTPAREGYQFFGWFTSASGLTPVANDSIITEDKTLFAFWKVDPTIWGGTFTYDASPYAYYARVNADVLNDESVLKYTNPNMDAGVDAALRKVWFNNSAAAGDVISMKVMFPEGHTAGKTLVIYGSKQLNNMFIDESGNVVNNADLVLGQWYTMSFISDGSGKYQIRPFDGSGVRGTFYMKDIEVWTGGSLQGDSAVSLGAAVVDGEILYNYKTSGTNTAQSRVLYFKNDGTHRALTYKIKFTTSEHADYDGFKGYVRHYSSGTYMYPVVTDETGKVIATDYNSCAANIKPDVWYNVILDAGEGNTLSSNIWTFTFDTDAKYDNATVEFEIKDIEYSDDVQTKHKVTYNLNYDGAPAAETFRVVENTAVGQLPTPTREGYRFVEWSKKATGWSGNTFTESTVITADTTVYAIWQIDPDVFGATFTYPYYGSYYVDVTTAEVGGETVIKFSNEVGKNLSEPKAKDRRVMLNIANQAGTFVSMDVMIESVKSNTNADLDSRELAIFNTSDTQLTTVFTDKDGNIVDNADLVLGQWYTMYWVSDGSESYQIRPFTADQNNIKGTFYMKNIAVLSGSNLVGDSAVSLSTKVVGGEIVYSYKTSGTNNASTRVLYFKNDGTHRILTYKIKFTKSECAAYEGFKGYIRHYSGGYVYPVVTDEAGNLIAYDANTVKNMQPGVWYNVILDAGAGNTLSDNIYTFTCDTNSTYDNATVEFDIKGVEYVDTAEECEISFNLNYEGAPAYGETKSVTAYSTYGTLPANATREGYAFAGWYLDAACTKPVNANTLVTKSHTLYAKWSTAVSFTYPQGAHVNVQINQYYASVTPTTVDGESVYQYTSTGAGDSRWTTGVTAYYRRVILNVPDYMGGTVSMKVKFTSVKNVSGTALNTTKLAIHMVEGQALELAITDTNGAAVAADALKIGEWYNVTFTGLGTQSYEIRPFDAGGEYGTFLMKDIKAAKVEVEDDFNPTLRFALTSDVHIYNRYQNSWTQKAHLNNLLDVAYGYANVSSYNKLDAVLVAGDISEGFVDEFQTFSDIVNAGLRGDTQLLVGMGNHDYRKEGGYTNEGALEMEAAFKEIFGLDSTDQHVVINGYHFIVLSPTAENLGLRVGESYSAEKLAWLEAQIQEAIAADPNKPVFVMQHHHANDTVYGSDYSTTDMQTHYAQLYDIFAKYPQVVDFSGHSHYPVNDPRNVWQGAFTAIGTGTLFYVGTDINGDGPDGITPDGYEGEYSTSGSKNGADYGVFQIVEVNADNDIRIIVYDLRTFEELYRFVIENPVDPANHVTNEQKAEASKAPEFALGAEVEVREIDGISYVYVPRAVSAETIESYRAYVTVDGVTTTYYGLSGYVYPNQPEYARIKIGSLDTTKDYRIEVVAVNAYGKTSEPLVMGVVVPTADITFDLNYDGAPAGPDAITLFVGEAYGELPVLTKTDAPYEMHSGGYPLYYSFAGWYLDEACTNGPVKSTDVVDQTRPLYAKWVEDGFVVRGQESLLSYEYIDGEWVYVRHSVDAQHNVDTHKFDNYHIGPAYAVSFKVKLTNLAEGAVANYQGGSLYTAIYSADGSLVASAVTGGTYQDLTPDVWYTFVITHPYNISFGPDYWNAGFFGEGTLDVYIKDISVASSIPANDAADRVRFYSQSNAAGIGNAIPQPVLRWVDGQWMYVYEGSQNTATEINGRQIGLYAYGNVYNVKFDLMMNNLNGESIAADILTDAGGYSTNFASYGIVYTIKDAQGNIVTDNFQAGEWYTIEMTGYDGGARTLDATGGNGDNWRLCTLGTGTGGLDVYIRNVEIITTPIA